MIKNKKVIVIIPARSGSKGLKNKNIMNLDGKPLLSWPIHSSLKSKYVDRTIVSTDSEKYSQIAVKYGAEIPFIRPKEISIDSSTSLEVIEHVIKSIGLLSSDIIILLEPTSPFTTSSDIDNCLEKFVKNEDCASLVGLSKSDKFHPDYSLQIDDENYIINYSDNITNHIARQKVTDIYYPDGSIYISNVNDLIKKKTFYHDKTMGYIFPKYKNIEIDDIYDFKYAESLLEYYYENQ